MHTLNSRTTGAAQFNPTSSSRRVENPEQPIADLPFNDDIDLWPDDQFTRSVSQPQAPSPTSQNMARARALSQTRQDQWFSAATDGDMDQLKYLHQRHLVDPDAKDKLGRNALHLAAQEGKYYAVQYLLGNCDLPIDERSDSKKNALHYAASGETIESRHCASILLKAAGNYAKAYANTTDWVGQTPLMYAASSGNESTVELLLRYGAEPDAENCYGSNALMDAAARGHKGIVVRLLASNLIRINKPNSMGTTALMMAAREGHPEMVSYLLSEGANPHPRETRHHYRALDLAKQRQAQTDDQAQKDKYQEIIGMLEQALKTYPLQQPQEQPPNCTLEFKKEPVPPLRR